MRIVVIGGTGNFGARICKRLAQESGLEILATSRATADSGGAGAIKTAILDIKSPTLVADLRSLAPDLVIHCAGPFQGQDYRVALATLTCGAHYIDIADGRDFVAGFVSAVGAAATAAGRLAITGASTLPALSAAVVDFLAERSGSLTEISIVIAPGQHAPRGTATVAAVLGYAGRPFVWYRHGKWQTAHGWQDLHRERFSFGTRWAAACDVPDLALLPTRYPSVQTVTFRASLEVGLQHLALWIIAAFRRIGLPLPVTRWASTLDLWGTWLNWLGSDTGGMAVHILASTGTSKRSWKTWELVAKDNHGPEIPCMASVILANKIQRGQRLDPGAQVCVGILSLSDFETEFRRWNISTSVTDKSD